VKARVKTPCMLLGTSRTLSRKLGLKIADPGTWTRSNKGLVRRCTSVRIFLPLFLVIKTFCIFKSFDVFKSFDGFCRYRVFFDTCKEFVAFLVTCFTFAGKDRS